MDVRLDDRSLFGYVYAEMGFVYYRLSTANVPYILQYMVGLNPTIEPPAYLHFPSDWNSFNLSLYALPQYTLKIWEWRDSTPIQITTHPSISYITDKYLSLNAKLSTTPKTIPLTFDSPYWRL